jgi:pre-rRNA-processing protein TSR4
MADEDFEDYDENEIDTGVQLGFVEMGVDPIPLLEKNWNLWDGGKCGGRPIWLNPSDLPSVDDLKCSHCHQQMIFLLQIYSPLDEPKDAFHRALYLFICRRRECVESFSAVKCIRCQLPRKNDFYSTDPDELGKSSELCSGPIPFLCALCGCRAPHQCSRCKLVSYCSKEHQKAHWKLHKKRCCSVEPDDASQEQSKDEKIALPLLFPEYEISVTAEVLVDLTEDAKDESVLKAHVWEDAVIKEDDVAAAAEDDGDSDEEDDAALTQNDYSKALGNEATDPVYMKFIERCRRGGPQQVLRYSRWNDEESALQLTADSYLHADRASERTAKIAPCQFCGAPRKFEFQVRGIQ